MQFGGLVHVRDWRDKREEDDEEKFWAKKIFRTPYSKITNTLFKRKMSKTFATLDSHTAGATYEHIFYERRLDYKSILSRSGLWAKILGEERAPDFLHGFVV